MYALILNYGNGLDLKELLVSEDYNKLISIGNDLSKKLEILYDQIKIIFKDSPSESSDNMRIINDILSNLKKVGIDSWISSIIMDLYVLMEDYDNLDYDNLIKLEVIKKEFESDYLKLLNVKLNNLKLNL